MIRQCDTAFREGREMREKVGIYLDINQYELVHLFIASTDNIIADTLTLVNPLFNFF